MILMPIISEHQYTLAATGFRMRTYIFNSRQSAKEKMYEIIDKNNLHVINKFEDKHARTYLCEGGIRFYINRV